MAFHLVFLYLLKYEILLAIFFTCYEALPLVDDTKGIVNWNYSVPDIRQSLPVVTIEQLPVPITATRFSMTSSNTFPFISGEATRSATQTATKIPLVTFSSKSIRSSTQSVPWTTTPQEDDHVIEVEPVASQLHDDTHEEHDRWLAHSDLSIWEGEPTHTLVARLRLRHPHTKCKLDHNGGHLFELEKRGPTLVWLRSRLSFDREQTANVSFSVYCDLLVPSPNAEADGRADATQLVRYSRNLVSGS